MRKLLLIGAAFAAAIAGAASAQPRGDREPGWSRSEMRAYGFRQTPQGARMTMNQDVLFATASDELYGSAFERLRPLARYLRANPGVRVAIDGHADRAGQRRLQPGPVRARAESVRDALDEMGVRHARFRVAGHGERNPIASNATAEGMRRNRRVEITLLGRRASEF